METPHLNQLAGESLQFSQYYVTPVYATTRASLLTGRHFLRTRVSHVHGGKDFLHLEENQTDGWTTDVLTDFAINFIRENRDRTFFAYLPG